MSEIGMWRDIDSAPKDGTVIDLWHKENGRMTDCWWDKDEERWIGGWDEDDAITHWAEITWTEFPK